MKSAGAAAPEVELAGDSGEAVSAPRRMHSAQVKKSITPDALVSFEDGKPYKTVLLACTELDRGAELFAVVSCALVFLALDARGRRPMSIDESMAPVVEPVSVFQSDLPIEQKLDRARMELLDLSARNRLLNIPRSAKSAKTLEIVDEKGAEVFRLLVREGRPFTFLPGKSASPDAERDSDEVADLWQPEDEELDARGVASRHADTRLQTRLTPPGLQKKLLDLYFDARTLEEEQGVNILFLAIGTLKWIDPKDATAVRYAPLLLVPVELERKRRSEGTFQA